MKQNKKEVVFDGKDLIFNVDGIEIKNGKLPDSFSIKERYEISAESLAKLVVALGEGNTLAEEVKSLQEEVRTERIKASDEGYKRYLLENLIKEHNKRSWWGRAEKIELKTEE